MSVRTKAGYVLNNASIIQAFSIYTMQDVFKWTLTKELGINQPMLVKLSRYTYMINICKFQAVIFVIIRNICNNICDYEVLLCNYDLVII